MSIMGLAAVWLLCMLSCSGGVDIAEQNRVLTSFSLAWPEGFDYTCASNEPLEVTISALDANGDLLDWSGTVNIALTNTNATVNLSSGTIQQNIAFNNATVQNQETNIKLSYGDVVTELTDTVLVYETIPPSDVDDFEAVAWDRQIGLSWIRGRWFEND